MVYFIIFVCIAAVLGPLLSALPSRQQRAVAAFRDRARVAGVRVQIVQPSNIPPRLQRAGDYPLVCYSRYNGKADIEPSSELWVRTRDGWEARSGDPVPAALTAVEKHIDVVALAPEGVQVFWDERGGEAVFDQVLAILDAAVDARL